MSIIVLKSATPSSVDTPAVGYVSIYINSTTGQGELKLDDGSTRPINQPEITGNLLVVKGETNDISLIPAPSIGDSYIIGGSPIGVIAGETGKYIEYTTSGWQIKEFIYDQYFVEIVGAGIYRTHISVGKYPTNVVAKYKFESEIKSIEIVDSNINIEDAVNGTTQFTINDYDTIFFKHINGAIVNYYVWTGQRNGYTYGVGGSNVAVSSDFFNLPTGKDSFNSSLFKIYDNLDQTKILKVLISSISSGQIRNILMPDTDVDLSKVNNAVQTDGSTPFVSTQQGVDGVASTDLVTVQQMNNAVGTNTKYSVEILSTDEDLSYVPSGTEKRYIVSHSLNIAQKELFVWSMMDKLTSTAVLPQELQAFDSNTVYVIVDGTYPTATDGIYITIIKG